jgi:hypothetical protein
VSPIAEVAPSAELNDPSYRGADGERKLSAPGNF